MFQATNQTFVLILFILYDESLLGLWFTVLVCTKCCLQKKKKNLEKKKQTKKQVDSCQIKT